MERLLNGTLGALYDRCRAGFDAIDVGIHCTAYEGTHNLSFAETEFAGKYLSACVRFARRGDETARAHAAAVAAAVVRNQRGDGYIGGLEPGREWDAFSVWNQAFTADGLLAYYEFTGDRAALDAAERSVQYAARWYLDDPAHDILDAPNYGTQHLAILITLPRLARITGNPVYRQFFDHICGRLRASDNNFFDCPDILHLRSRKGIENFVALIGLADGCDDGRAALRNYARQLHDTQIRRTGNGTIRELWTENGNAPQLLTADVKPNETCVAVGWMETNFLLFGETKDPAYLDDIEQTLYNHLLAAADPSGADFAYYQPNFGRRVTRTADSMYKCCRYRGFFAVSCLPDALFCTDGGAIVPMLYTSAEFCDGGVRVTETTDYPYDGTVRFRVDGAQIPPLRLRIPRWSARFDVTVNGQARALDAVGGSVTVDGLRGGDEVVLRLYPELRAMDAEIDGVPHRSYTCGCVLLAVDAADEAGLCVPGSGAAMVRADAGDARLAFTDGAVRWVDYASARRAYSVWGQLPPSAACSLAPQARD